MAWYDTGTVKVTANNAVVIGSGTKWLAGARQGEAFIAPDGRLYEVLNIASDTSLTLTKPYRGSTATSQQYALAPMQGYVKELADRAAELLPTLSDIGTAAKGTLTISAIDPTPGRVMRNGDWGVGGGSGVVADQNILNNTVNGIYRSGSADTEAPDKSTGASYFKMGWGTTYYGLLYVSPIQDKWHVRTVSNGNPNSWKELMTVGTGGLASSGAGTTDTFPSVNLDATGVGSGMYYYNAAIGDVSGLPFGTATSADRQGIALHRMAGTAGAQIVVSGSGRLAWRGRNASSYRVFKEAVAVGDFGIGGGQASPPNGRASSNPTGWYYAAGSTPSFGSGAFFLDLAYNTTAINSGLRISTDPYTDNFYMNGAVSGQRTYRDACKLIHDKNIVGSVMAGSVIESGSNSNGSWTKFADGMQICQGNQNFPGNGWNGKRWTFPLAFVSQPIVVASGMGDNGGFASAPIIDTWSTGYAYCTFHKITNSPENDNWANFGCIAIGRWK